MKVWENVIFSPGKMSGLTGINVRMEVRQPGKTSG